jgi:hypothetical protein
MDEEKRDALLAQYIDLINKHGTNSKEAKEFKEKHTDDQTLVKRMEAARNLKLMFLEGYLKPECVSR